MILKMKDVEQYYSDKVREQLNNGYRFYHKGMSGSQGDICKVALATDEDIITIRLTSYQTRPVMESKEYISISYCKIIIEKYYDFETSTLWNDKGEYISSKFFYIVKNPYGKGKNQTVFTDNYIEAVKIAEKQSLRFSNNKKEKYKNVFDGDKIKLLPILKNHKGFSQVTKKDITEIIHLDDGYIITTKKRDCFIPKQKQIIC